MKGTFRDFLGALKDFESGVDMARFKSGQITEAQIRGWVGESNWQQYKAGNLSWSDLQYRSENSLGFVGYQFGEALMIDLGYYKASTFYGNGAARNNWQGTFTGKNGIKSLTDLKTDIQEAVILDAFGFNLNVIQKGLAASGKSLADFIGTKASYVDTSTGQKVEVDITLTGILAAAHLRGAWGTLDLLKRGAVSSDEYGTSILKYMTQFGGYESPEAAKLIATHLNGGTEKLAEQIWGRDIGSGLSAPDPAPKPDPDPTPPTDPDPTPPVDPAPTPGPTTGKTVSIDWAWGKKVAIDFNPKTDKIDFNWFQPGQFTISEKDGSTIISVPSNNQSYTLKGVGLKDLTTANLSARDPATRDALNKLVAGNGTGTGEPTNPDPTPDPVTPPKPNPDPVTPPDPNPNPGPTTDPSAGKTITLAWAWGKKVAIDFNPKTDKIDFDWFQPGQFTITENNGSTVITIPTNNQSYTLKGVALKDLTTANLSARDPATREALNKIVTGDGTGKPSNPDAKPDQVTPPDPKPNPDPDPVTPPSPGPSGDGKVYAMKTNGANISGFNPQTDKLDLGTHSVHSFIIVDTAAGVGFRNPWNGDTQYLLGVRLADLNTSNFKSIGNAHLREDVSGALAWEKGITPAANTVYYRTHEVGQTDKVDFNPSTDKVSLLYASTREQFKIADSSEGVVISNGGTGQSLVLKGVKIADLSAKNFQFHFTQVREDHLDQQLGFTVGQSQIVSRDGIPTAGGNSTPPTPHMHANHAGMTSQKAEMEKTSASEARTVSKDRTDEDDMPAENEILSLLSAAPSPWPGDFDAIG